MALGVDNFHAHSAIADRVIDEISSGTGLIVLGVHSNSEAEVLEALRTKGISARTRYLGKLGLPEVRAMAELTSSSRSDLLATSVIGTLRAEHLPRTPFTVAMLISIMMRGESLIANASPTAILEQYVSHLLGRDDANQDPRFSLTITARESIVTDLATLFVESDQGSMLQSDVIARMERFFDTFAWSESPADVLANLVERRLLSFEGSQVRFTQSSFLHLFAAKAVAKKRDLLTSLLLRPLYYAPVLRAYAALVRNDSELLSRIAPMIEMAIDLDSSTSVFLSKDPKQASPDLPEIIESSLNGADSWNSSESAGDNDAYDVSGDGDVLPFPLTTDADLPAVAKYAQGVDLVSAILRDSEEIADLALKTNTLIAVLRGWGHLIDAYRQDEQFQELVRKVKEQIAGLAAGLGEDVQVILDEFVGMLPAIIVQAGIDNSLASRKLLLITKRAIEQEDIKSDPQAAIPAAMLIYAINDPEWDVAVATLLDGYEGTPVVEHFFSIILTIAFDQATAKSREESRLRDLLLRGYLSRLKFSSQAQRNAVKSAYLQHLQRAKALSRGRANDELDG